MICFRYLLLRRARSVEVIKLKRKKAAENKRDLGNSGRAPINSILSERRPSFMVDKKQGEDMKQLKIDNKYCEDFVSALKFWDHTCIVDAYFNQAASSTVEEIKLKDRLRKKK